MSIREDSIDVLLALASVEQGEGDSQRGRYTVASSEVSHLTGLTPGRINDAIELLEERRLAEVQRWLGTSPYSFGSVELTALGRLRAEEEAASNAATAPEAAPDARVAPGTTSTNQSGGITANSVFISGSGSRGRAAPRKQWYAKGSVQAALVTGVFVIVAAVIANQNRTAPSGPQPDVVASVTPELLPSGPLRDSLRRESHLRQLTPAEDATWLGDAPPGIFGFASHLELDPGGVTLTRLKNGPFGFEVQRTLAGQTLLVAFASADAAAQLARRSHSDGVATLYSEPWTDASSLVVVPLDSVRITRRARLIQLSERQLLEAISVAWRSRSAVRRN